MRSKGESKRNGAESLCGLQLSTEQKEKETMNVGGQIVKLTDHTSAEIRAIRPANAAAFGKELNDAAIERQVSVKRSSLINVVQDFHRQKEIMLRRIREAEIRIEQLEQRLKDIENGDYVVTEDAQILFPHLPPPHIG